MHNKSFIVDNAAAVVGGRNIADEYFNLNQEGEFLDFDMLIFGEVSEALSVEFDRYWNDERSVPAEVVVGRISEQELADFRNNLSREKLEPARKHYQEAFDSDLMLSIGQQETRFYSADAIVITDDPDKLVTAIDVENRLLVKALAEVVNEVTSEVVVMTPSFIPGEAGVDFWRSIVARGVRVVIVTNSLAANNHTAVHSGYARYRKDIIRAGVELFEARADAVAAEDKTMTMHTKAMIFDRESVFVGSLNLDPRSIAINSEMGVVVSSPEMTESLSTRLFSNLPQWTYRVTLNEQGKLRWHANIDGEEVVETKEPLASWWRRFSAWFLRIAPENQL
jgi:putative cardiolipin synthase